jgi:RNA polymerase sigma factor for flagellar operon FliA
MGTSLQELVNAFVEDPSEGLRNAIISQAMPLVKSIIGKIKRPDNALSQYEDLESVGVMGLLQALDNYDASKNIQFNTFAYYRIRGSVIDYLRSIDEMPRLQRANYGKAQEVISRLQQELGRDPKEEEVAEAMEISVDDYRKILETVQQRAFLSLDHDSYGDEKGDSLVNMIEDKNIDAPDADLDRESVANRIQAAIKNLKERERLILALYYYEDLTLAEIAQLLGLTEARISQIIGKLLLQLKTNLDPVVFH